MRVHYETKIEDLQEWRRELLSLPEIRKLMRQQRLVGGLFVAGPVFIMLTTAWQDPLGAIFWAVIAFFGSVVMRRVVEVRQWTTHLKNVSANTDGMSILGKNALEINDEQVMESGAYRSYAVHWEIVKRILVRPRHVMFVLNNYQGIIVPLDSIEPQSDREPFLESLERCAPVELREDFFGEDAGE